jgi:preprotein translocase subunit YajC
MDFLLLAQDTAQPAQPAQPVDPAAGPQQGPPGGGLLSLLPFVLMAVVFWFVLIRPQRKQEKERQKRVESLKRGDKVRTRGGIVAPVIRVKDDEVILGLGGDRALEVAIHKGYIDEVLSAGGKPEDAKK